MMERGAIISDCGTYRYRLWRRWADGPACVFVMLNPSTADAIQDDPTIRRCIGFAKRMNCGRLDVVNLFAVRSRNPKALRECADPIGPENDTAIIAATRPDTANPVIAAWGAHPFATTRAGRVIDLLPLPWCLGKTKSGHPRHPLYVPAGVELRPLIGDTRIGDLL